MFLMGIIMITMWISEVNWIVIPTRAWVLAWILFAIESIVWIVVASFIVKGWARSKGSDD